MSSGLVITDGTISAADTTNPNNYSKVFFDSREHNIFFIESRTLTQSDFGITHWYGARELFFIIQPLGVIGTGFNINDIVSNGTGNQLAAFHQGKLVSSGSNRGILIENKTNISGSASTNSRLDVFHYGVTT